MILQKLRSYPCFEYTVNRGHRFENSPDKCLFIFVQNESVPRVSVVPVECSIQQPRQIFIKRLKQIPQFVMKIMFKVMASGSSFATSHTSHSGGFETEKLSLTIVNERILVDRCRNS